MRSPSSAWRLKKTIKKSVRNSKVKRGPTESSLRRNTEWTSVSGFTMLRNLCAKDKENKE